MSQEEHERSVVQESEGLASRGLAWLGVAAIVVFLACLFVVWRMLPPNLMRKPVTPKEPDDAISSVRQGGFDEVALGIRETREARERLDDHGWVNRDAGIAMMPVDEAMRLYVEQHDAGGSTP